MIPELPVDSALHPVSSKAKVDVALTAIHGVVLHTATHIFTYDHRVFTSLQGHHISVWWGKCIKEGEKKRPKKTKTKT